MSKKTKHSSGAVAKSWAIFNKNPKAARKAAVAACVKAGVNENTAKTQFQAWSHASKAERVAKVA